VEIPKEKDFVYLTLKPLNLLTSSSQHLKVGSTKIPFLLSSWKGLFLLRPH